MDDLGIRFIDDNEIPAREPPIWSGNHRAWGRPEQANPCVIVTQKVLTAVERHARSYPQEVGGLLIGEYFRHQGVIYILVNDYLEARTQGRQQSSATHVNFSPEVWADLLRRQDQLFPTLKTVGWFHSHPRHGIFLSVDDMQIHRGFFTRAWQTALVYDPINHQGGFFTWQNGQVGETVGFYELFDPGVRNSRLSWKEHRPVKVQVTQPASGPAAGQEKRTGGATEMRLAPRQQPWPGQPADQNAPAAPERTPAALSQPAGRKTNLLGIWIALIMSIGLCAVGLYYIWQHVDNRLRQQEAQLQELRANQATLEAVFQAQKPLLATLRAGVSWLPSPGPVITHTPTPSPSPTDTATPAPTATPTLTATSSPSATATNRSSPTATVDLTQAAQTAAPPALAQTGTVTASLSGSLASTVKASVTATGTP